MMAFQCVRCAEAQGYPQETESWWQSVLKSAAPKPVTSNRSGAGATLNGKYADCVDTQAMVSTKPGREPGGCQFCWVFVTLPQCPQPMATDCAISTFPPGLKLSQLGDEDCFNSPQPNRAGHSDPDSDSKPGTDSADTRVWGWTVNLLRILWAKLNRACWWLAHFFS